MFRRNSSTRLGRSKSTSSVHQSKQHESIDPEIARQHAHAAATRGQLHHKSRVQTANSNSNFERLQQAYSQPPIESSSTGEHVIKRQQSVRFAGPNAVQRRQSTNTRSTQHTLPSKASTTTLRPVAMTTSAPVPAVYRPPSRSSSIGKASFGNATAQTEFVTALAAYDEYYTREPEVPSTPSSYRRLRKSKSMFSPLKAPSVFYTNGTPERSSSRLGRQNSTTSSRTARTSRTARSKPYHIAPLRTPKSMSFLRGSRDGYTHKHDEGVQQARDRFFQHAAQERLREQPSFLFRSRTQKPEKPFRKSVRSGSGHSDPLPDLPDHDTTPSSLVQNSKLREKARKASKTLKFKLKRVFGFINQKDEPIAIPNQQVEAHETHVRQYSCPPNQEAFEDIPYPDSESLSRVASRQPSLRILGSKEQLRSHAGSVRSAKSFTTDDDNSRVTSWTSTAANTIGSSGVPNPARVLSEREQQRLSIIQENGTHISSSSFRRKGLRNQFSAYPLVRPPSRDGPVSTASNGKSQGVDSARVYSALMKRLDECSPKPNLTTRASEDTLRSPRRSTDGKENQKYATIRHVRNDSGEEHTHQWVKSDSVHSARAEDVFGFTGSHVHQWVPADGLREKRMREEDGDVFTTPGTGLRAREVEREVHPSHHRAYSNASTSVVSIQQPSNKTSFYTVPEEIGRTPQEIALRNEPVVIEPKRLRESRSTFFGGSTMTISRTTSPFRQVMNQNGDSGSPSLRKDEKSPARKSVYLAVDGPFDSGSMEDEKADSVSLYSRTTSGQTLAANSALSLLIDQHEQQEQIDISDLSVHDSSKGDVIIIDRSTYRSLSKRDTTARDPSKTHSVTSSAGSNEWKRWMSSEVAKLERGKENRDHKAGYAGPLNSHPKSIEKKEYPNFALPRAYQPTTAVTVGHLRESAQIDDEDVEIAQGARVGVRLPVGMVQVVNEQNQNVNERNRNQDQQNRNQQEQQQERIHQSQALSQPNQQSQNSRQGFLKPILKNKSSVSLIESSGNTLGVGSGHQTSASCGNTPSAPLSRQGGLGVGTASYIPIPPPIPGRSPLRSMQSKASLRSVGTATGLGISSGAGGNGTGTGRNVLHKKNVSKASLRSVKSFTVDTPCATPRARLVKRKGVAASQRVVGSMRARGREVEGPAAGSEARDGDVGLSGFFSGSGDGGRPFEREESEDFYGVEWGVGSEDGRGRDRDIDIYGVGGGMGKGGELSESDAQALGSRKMVELFLSSRRKRINGGSEEGGVFL